MTGYQIEILTDSYARRFYGSNNETRRSVVYCGVLIDFQDFFYRSLFVHGKWKIPVVIKGVAGGQITFCGYYTDKRQLSLSLM